MVGSLMRLCSSRQRTWPQRGSKAWHRRGHKDLYPPLLPTQAALVQVQVQVHVRVQGAQAGAVRVQVPVPEPVLRL